MKYEINSLAVYEFGDRKNPSIIFVHGFPFDHTMWKEQINELQKDHHLVVYDIRGLGESYVGDGQYTMEAYVSDLFSVMEGMKLNKPVLSSNQTLIWDTLEKIGKNNNIKGFGSLFTNS